MDLVHGGYPCQPYSQAGKRTGDKHESFLWPHVLRVLLETGAPVGFFENVRGHLKRGFPEVRAELEACGFTVDHIMLGAEDVGAPHGRQRLFILAYSNDRGLGILRDCWKLVEGVWQEQWNHADGQGCPSACLRGRGVALGDPSGERLEGVQPDGGHPDQRLPGPAGAPLEWPPRPNEYEAWRAVLERRPDLEPALRRVAHGPPNRVDRLHALGNGVVPKQATEAFRTLLARVPGIS